MILRKTPEEIDKMAAAGQILARCHELLRKNAIPAAGLAARRSCVTYQSSICLGSASM